ncbi:HD domain-containing protein [Sediminibacillus halophilus]|uniref:Putative hydrolases of HD superfamily n=1 Tax=Sediminibacillus halophilus TaxID=482461 RepID=A0A1G9P856_9BACI|nr:HD domain-containing protein [Sediminibacillus halophilus]SDL94884.1 putative hydrolases of HD superfamily [Sediminibacillus halophilus]
MNEALKRILEVLKLAEKLKYELRHSWLSNGRQESVAEHSWRVALMAVFLEPYLDKQVDTAKLLKMITIHDLVEAEATDIPAFDTMDNQQAQMEKQERELQAIENIRKTLGGDLGKDIQQLWLEFEDKSSYEAKVANALDKLEAQLQHNEAAIDTWLEVEYKMSFMLGRHTDFDQALISFRRLVEQEAESKLTKAGVSLTDVNHLL